MLDRVAQLYDEVARSAPEGSAVREEAAAAALAARTRLADYVGETDWTKANQEDPEAIQQAEQLVRAATSGGGSYELRARLREPRPKPD